MDATQKRQPPCREEFVAQGYPAENYEKHFAGEEWGPTWSDPGWSPVKSAARELPERLAVHSQVRKLESRLTRRKQPTRHRFKQHLFGDPSRRLLRNRPVLITSTELVQHFEELHSKESVGILAVRTLDGQRLNLAMLRDGILALAARPSPLPPLPPPLDSIANDIPAGIALPQQEGGTFVGDPAAARVLAALEAEKRAEGIRQGALEDDAVDEEEVAPSSPSAPLATEDEVTFDFGTEGTDAAVPVESAVEVPAAADPAAQRIKRKKRR